MERLRQIEEQTLKAQKGSRRRPFFRKARGSELVGRSSRVCPLCCRTGNPDPAGPGPGAREAEGEGGGGAAGQGEAGGQGGHVGAGQAGRGPAEEPGAPGALACGFASTSPRAANAAALTFNGWRDVCRQRSWPSLRLKSLCWRKPRRRRTRRPPSGSTRYHTPEKAAQSLRERRVALDCMFF